MHTRLRQTAVIAAVGMVLLAGCRNDATAGTSASEPPGAATTPVAIDVCELLTDAEVERAFRRPVNVEAATEIDCNYTTVDADVLDTTDLTTTLISPAGVSAELFPSVIAAGVGNDFSTQQVDGPGDATMLSTQGEIAILNVLAGDHWLTLAVLAPAESDRSAETLTDLADLAVQRLS